MKFSVEQPVVTGHWAKVARIVPSRPSLPVLGNVLVNADEKTQQITLTGFDLSIGLETTFPASVEKGGSLTMPAKLMNDILVRLPQDDVFVEEDNFNVAIACGESQYQVRGLSADDYPELPTVGEKASAIAASILAQGLAATLFCTSTDESKQVLTGVHFTYGSHDIEFAATDGHRLAVLSFASNEEEQPLLELDITIPRKALLEVNQMIGKTDSVSIQYEQGLISFAADQQRLTCRLLEGQYPNYRHLIPAQFSNSAVCDRKSLITALERIAVLAGQKNNIVKLEFGASQLTISVEAADVGSGRELVPVQFTGDAGEYAIAFNVNYLLDGLKAMGTAEVNLQMNSPTSPAVIAPLGGEKQVYLIMPVQIRS